MAAEGDEAMDAGELLPHAEVGVASAGGNFVLYTRSAVRRGGAAPDAPVLVVEDDEGTRRLFERVLTLQGFEVRTAADSGEFAAALRVPPLPRLILLDLELPRVDGFRLLALLRQQALTRSIPVVMVTGHTESK